MKKTEATRFDYVNVQDIQPGQIILNVGIVKQVFPHRSTQQIQILFNPSRGTTSKQSAEKQHSMWYSHGDRLMLG